MSDQQLLERINAACKQGIENYRIGESKSVIVGSLEEIEELLAEPAEAPAPAQPIAPNRDSNWLNELPTEPTTVVHVPVPDGNESRYVEVLREQSQAAQPTANGHDPSCMVNYPIRRNGKRLCDCGAAQPVAEPSNAPVISVTADKVHELMNRALGNVVAHLELEHNFSPCDAIKSANQLLEPMWAAFEVLCNSTLPPPSSGLSVEEIAPLTFARFSAVNRQRCESPGGFNHQLASWSTSDWFTAVMGELGEAANVAKKLNRYRDGVPGNKVSKEELHFQLRKELGDVFIYLDLLAQSLGTSIADAAVEVFNAKSKEIGCPILITEALSQQAGRLKDYAEQVAFDRKADQNRIDVAEARNKELGEQLEFDRTAVASGVTAIKKAVDSRHWLTEGRGPYEWDDDNWHQEFKAAAIEILTAVKPLAKIAADWKQCPKTSEEVAQARIDLKAERDSLSLLLRENVLPNIRRWYWGERDNSLHDETESLITTIESALLTRLSSDTEATKC